MKYLLSLCIFLSSSVFSSSIESYRGKVFEGQIERPSFYLNPDYYFQWINSFNDQSGSCSISFKVIGHALGISATNALGVDSALGPLRDLSMSDFTIKNSKSSNVFIYERKPRYDDGERTFTKLEIKEVDGVLDSYRIKHTNKQMLGRYVVDPRSSLIERISYKCVNLMQVE